MRDKKRAKFGGAEITSMSPFSLKRSLANSISTKTITFLPKEKKFFDLFEALAEKAMEAAHLLKELEQDYSNAKVVQISEELGVLEDAADDVVHQIITGLFYDHTRVTEEKGDIRYFAHNLDNVVDGVDKAVNRLTFARTETLPQAVKEFSAVIMEAAEEIEKGVICLRDMKREEKTLARCCIYINELEEKADKLNRKWLKKLLTVPPKDFEQMLNVYVLKEIIDILEDTMDQCEDVANILDTFRVKGGI
jgi:hypothetical protein